MPKSPLSPKPDEPVHLSPGEMAKLTGINRVRILLRCQAGKVPGAWQDFNGYWRIPATRDAIRACSRQKRGRKKGYRVPPKTGSA